MAKRKRLEIPTETVSVDLETKSEFSAARARMPIADVAGEVAGRAALEEVAREMTAAENEGRVVKKLPLAQVEMHHLSRDRMVIDPEELAALKASIADRGQQTPIEVVRLSGGRFGLISGLRRMEALRTLGAEHVLALIKSPDGSREAYQAMIEENEIRVGLSFYERANIAVIAVTQGIFPDERAAVKGLFAHAPKAKRSKILKFVTLRAKMGASLSFPEAIPEHLGFKLAQAIENDPKLASRISAALRKADISDAAAERQVLERALKTPARPPKGREIAPGLTLEARSGRAVFSGQAVDKAFLEALENWAAGQAG